ncbi:hypothetical protein [Tuwongella immobilis]|uniref:Uncharacterized protein n=1 Tax=Tuwongella immobilis TaxID=692036 RepID=A0A6C2YI61_9BACT|nr:hypothetical protein [Tuwongella immobilis]VIP00682.1 Uncharacterized protein OS=Pirellula staleyi (strain ATCC 27377 / DSM 6068 / ICPB 4128) GN=Psta_4566 PE=4 SV=1 [Tuwongella immobilis]VTR96782.1 Uncharacterized protein OS=Pirellula staleyi (strain ATCC 27377 / DSM 6068 / ICPB 4128) GN=Psta_4566 PE=4 SV=1 [Tuwongella immobilis]
MIDPIWPMVLLGYLVTVAMEAPILLLGLSRQHPLRRRIFAGFWLTACTYPIVVMVMPMLWDATTDRMTYLLVAECFAPIAECILFAQLWPATRRDWLAIALANFTSFLVGEWLHLSGQTERVLTALGLL